MSLGIRGNQVDRTYDHSLELKDAGPVHVSGAAQVGGEAKVVDLGNSRLDASVVLTVTALEIDAAEALKDAGLVDTDSAATVGGTARVIDLGTAEISGDIVVTATAVQVSAGDEAYAISAQLSNSSTFASGVAQGASITLGDAAAIAGATVDNGVETYTFTVTNTVGGTTYRYLRLYNDVTGTPTTGVNYSANFEPRERYDVFAQFSNSETFASDVVTQGGLSFGSVNTLPGITTSTRPGRYEFSITNDVDGVIYRYMRLYHQVSGWTSTGIDYFAGLYKLP